MAYSDQPQLFHTQKTAVDYFNAMVERYPDRLGRTVLWATDQAVYGIRENLGEDWSSSSPAAGFDLQPGLGAREWAATVVAATFGQSAPL